MKNKLEKVSILTFTALALVAFQNCAPGTVTSAKKVDAIGLQPDGTSTVDTTPVGLVIDSTGADLKPTSVNYSENLVTSMQNQLGVAAPSARTLAAYNAGKGQLSAKGPFNNVDTVNQPMWGAITTIAGEFCVDAINLEKTKAIGTAAAPGPRSFFNQVNFTLAPASVAEAVRADVIRRLALSLWGRQETVTERTQIQTALTATLALAPVAGTSAALQTENAMLFICTAMLASLDGVRN